MRLGTFINQMQQFAALKHHNMKKLKHKVLYSVDVYCMGQYVQWATFRYKKDAVLESRKHPNCLIEKRKLITDKY